ncbi:MAG TPA: patatin-like phospholipase family protein, partial [bacterium]|nr:patatin-like phospholipase family protein [bacterium]
MKWALVLSGGGARGIAHVGVLRGCERLGMTPDLIVGCSMGAIIGGLYCSGMSTGAMEHWLEDEFRLDDHMDL